MENPPIFSDDPIYLKSLVGRSVSVQTVDNVKHVGVVYVIDPIYKTLVLLKDSKLVFILHRAITNFDIVEVARNEALLQEKNENGLCDEDLKSKKLRLLKWLQHMFIEVKEDGEFLQVEKHLIIGPPYGKTECMSDNTIVLQRIYNIIDLMPSDFK